MRSAIVPRIERELRTVVDPELGIDVVALGLIYGISFRNHTASIRMTLTTPGCPFSAYLISQVRHAALRVRGVTSVDVEIVFEPPWVPAMADRSALPFQ